MRMTHRITLYLVTEHDKASEVLSDLIAHWEELYGGVTTYEADGHWAGISESVTAVETVCLDNPFNREDLKQVQERIIKHLGEDAVLATVDDVDTIMTTKADVATGEAGPAMAD